MATPREMRQRIKSVKNISQVTRALEAVSASRVRRAEQAVKESRPYANKAWQVLLHLSAQPARGTLHPLLQTPASIERVMAIVLTGDRGLAGAYNANIQRFALERMRNEDAQVHYVAVGRKGRDFLRRRQVDLQAEFSNLPAEPSYADVSPIGRLAIEEFLAGGVDKVYLFYTDFQTLLRQVPRVKQLLPLQLEAVDLGGEMGTISEMAAGEGPQPAYIYEPGQEELLDLLLQRFIALQVYEAVQESLASEHAARMVAMRNATDNANELAEVLQLDYNKARQQAITSEMLDIVGGVEAQAE